MERKEYIAPDLHAPRHRIKTHDYLAYPEKDVYGFFATMKAQNPNLAKYSNRDIANWIKEYNRALAQEVVK